MQLKNKILLLSIGLLGILFGCKDSKIQNENPSIVLPSDFQEFYDRFHSDSTFQLSRVIFPLEGGENQFGNSSQWSRESWKVHKPFDASLSNYTRSFDLMNEIIIEKIKDKYNAFFMERRFSKIQEEWHLIYYSATYYEPELVSDTLQ